MKEASTISSIEKVTPTDVTIKNADGTKTVAPATMLSKDDKGNLMLNKAAVKPGVAAPGAAPQQNTPQPGQKVAVVTDSLGEAKASNFDAELEIANPYFDPNGPDDENAPSYYEDSLVGVNFDYGYEGSYRPATWGYHGGEPAEYPDLVVNIHDVTDLDTGKDITKDVDLAHIEKLLINSGYIKDADEWAREQAEDNFVEPDDYYEGINRIRKLSGLK